MAAWTAVVDALLVRVQAVVVDAEVGRGQFVSEDVGDMVFIAVADLDDAEWTTAGTFRQSMQSFGGAREEVGPVNCVILARDGDGDQAACTDTAFGYLAAIEADVRADKTLGLTAFDYVVAEMDSGEIHEIQAQDGAATALPFVISYKIRIQ
jgi:hypothetical protein